MGVVPRQSALAAVSLFLALIAADACARAGSQPEGGRNPRRPGPTSAQSGQRPEASSQPVAAEGERGVLWHEGFESGDIGPGWTGRSVARGDALRVVTSPVRTGRHALRVIVGPGDSVTPGDRAIKKERAELIRLNVGEEGRQGTEQWYAWSLLIPTEYEDVEARPRDFQIMGQWHDPIAGSGHTPPIAVEYVVRSGRRGMRVSYGLKQKKPFYVPIQKGQWQDWVFHIRWSTGPDGFLEAWLNGQPVTNGKVTGPNMWVPGAHYLRLGIYRAREHKTTSTIYYDEIRIGKSREDVLAR